MAVKEGKKQGKTTANGGVESHDSGAIPELPESWNCRARLIQNVSVSYLTWPQSAEDNNGRFLYLDY